MVDKYGGAEGIASPEDILEVVMRAIQDEYDVAVQESQMIGCRDDGTLLVNARIDLGGELDIKLPEGRYTGLAGFLPEKTGEIPQVGSHSEDQKLRLTVMRGFARSVEEVRIK